MPDELNYKIVGTHERFWGCRDRESVVSGPAGTGKTLGALCYLWACLERYPNCRALIVRKTRKSLSETALVTWENLVPASHPCRDGATRSHRQSYDFPNGSTLVVAGCDNWEKIKSAEFDLVYAPECTELLEEDWEGITSRLRNNRMPYQRIFGCCNPDSPHHWVLKRRDAGKLSLFESTHRDNPAYYDPAAGDWTPQGRQYLALLESSLTGVRLERLLHGRWVIAEGAVYPEYQDRLHLVTLPSVPDSWRRYLSIDFGFTNPACLQWWAEDHDGGLYLYREVYHTGLTATDLADLALALSAGEPVPVAVVADHDADGIEQFERVTTWPVTRADKSVSIRAGIDEVKLRLQPPNGAPPAIHFCRDALVAADPALVAARRPTCTLEEVTGYVWRKDPKSGQYLDEPAKLNDHGMDALRYLCVHRRPNRSWVAPPEHDPKPRSLWEVVAERGSSLYGQRRAGPRPAPVGVYGQRRPRSDR